MIGRTMIVGYTSHEGEDQPMYVVIGQSVTRIWYAHGKWVDPAYWRGIADWIAQQRASERRRR